MTEAAGAVADSMIGQLAEQVRAAQSSLITSTVTWWLSLPPVDVERASAAQVLQRWMVPFAVLVSIGGIMWQSLLMIINRKGEPLVAVVKGLFTTALFGAVSLTGTQMLLTACEAYTEWVLTWGMDCAPELGQDQVCKTDALAERMQLILLPLPPGVGNILIVVMGLIVLVGSIAQAMLLLFRSGAIIILAGVLQLAASGSFTAATSNWLRRILGWLLALTFYEPFAATSYAVAFMLIGDPATRDVSTWFTGAGMLGLSLVALPAMMKFFNWTVGSVQQSGNSAGMFAAAGAAGLHAIASRRGAGGMTATDYAREIDRRNPPPSSGSGDSGSGPPRPTPPTFIGPAPTASTTPSAGTTTATTASTTAGTAATATATSGTAAAGVSAATGPAAPVVAGVVVGAQVARTAARSASSTAARTTEGG
ncbi:hypothetical protein [Micromonospora sonchi]|uniref:hypothetical protein n=1 Tax=Micromonospora sonchi TaxID=1763543 RepID=UPI001E288BAC|nr:hypothetical protein [Micromonospora sonchi]